MTVTHTDDLLTLLSPDTRLRRVASTNGGEYAGPCPFCGGTDRFRVWPTPPDGHPRWWCRQCNKSGDTIAYLVDCGDITPTEAGRLRHLSEERAPRTRSTDGGVSTQPKAPPTAEPPPADWQATAKRLVELSEKRLWADNCCALDHVRQWGLTDTTIRGWHLGWHPGGNCPRGIVIPHVASGTLWAVKFRCYAGNVPVSAPKYSQLQGGSATLFGVDQLRGTNRTLLLTEGEKDALLAWQELGDLVDVASLAGATKKIPARWMMYLLPYDHILLAYDNDPAGQSGAANLAGQLRSAQSLALPVGNDIVDLHSQGHNLRAWLRFHLDRLWIVPGWRPVETTGPKPRINAATLSTVQSQGQARDIAEAKRLGSLYWTLYPLSDWNRQLGGLASNLELCRRWASNHGVLDVLEQALRDAAPEGMDPPR